MNFIMAGLMSLLCWNVVLNIPGYFYDIFKDPEVTQKYLFGYSFGGLLSFVLSPYIFSYFSTKKQIYIAIALIGLSFFSLFVLVEADIEKDLKIVLSITFVSISGYFSSLF